MSPAEVVLALLLLSVLLVVVATLAAWRIVDRRNRVSVSRPTPAPTWWLVLPTEAARLHRRLRAAVVSARLVVPRRRRRDRRQPASPLADLVDDLEAQAVALDLHVVAAGRGPARERRQRLRGLDPHVRQIEQLSARLVAAAVAAQAHAEAAHHPGGLDAIGERLDALDAARDELAAIEAALGLRTDAVPAGLRAPGVAGGDGRRTASRPRPAMTPPPPQPRPAMAPPPPSPPPPSPPSPPPATATPPAPTGSPLPPLPPMPPRPAAPVPSGRRRSAPPPPDRHHR